MQARTVALLTASVIFVLDQLSKAWVTAQIPLHESIPVIPGFFRISHVLNRGAAFSLFADASSRWPFYLLVTFSVVVVLVVVGMLWKSTTAFERTTLALSLVLGGALGNLADRLRLGHVVDFLAFNLGRYQWPDFNIADSAIVSGALLLAMDMMKESRKHKAQV